MKRTARIILYALIACHLCPCLVATGQEAPWRGSWIGMKEPAGPNSWLCFRKQVDLAGAGARATARIACDSKYWLWINGELAVFEGQLKRGPTPQDTYYDEVDIAPYLRKGTNTIAVLVWYWGKHGFSHNDSGKAGLVFDARIGGQSLVSDATWKVGQHPAYGPTEPPGPNYRLSESNVLFDARKDLTGWTASDYDDASWSRAAAFGVPPEAPWNQLEKRPVRLWKDSGLLDYVGLERARDADGTQRIIGKLPYNAQVTPYLKVCAEAGRRIDIRTDNYLGGGSPNVRAIYITRGGVQEYESLGWMNGHDVRYTVPKDVTVLEVKYRETGYNADFVGRFDCDDASLNTLWQKSRRTLYITMRDNYMDCPDRERAQWWGDMVNELGEAFYVFDAEKGPLLAKKGIYELARWQRDDLTLYSPVPSGRPQTPVRGDKQDGLWDIELPRQMLASVGWYGFWTYYWYTGDKQTIEDVYPHVRDYLSLWTIGADGLVVHRTGEWDWTDWGENKDVAVLENAWVVLALKAGVEMARLTGNDADVAGYQQKMESIQAHFNKAFWRGDRYHSPAYSGQTDDRANAMAVVAGLAEPAYTPALTAVLKSQYHASPYMEKYVLEALYMMDAPEQAVERMKRRWKNQIASELTTLWEGWGLGSEGYGGGTYNHAWSGGPLTMLSQYAAGIAPTKPAFREFAVLPQMGPLKRIESTVSTPQGLIQLNLVRTKGRFTLDLRSPAGTKAIVGIPQALGDIREVRVNGRMLWEKGKAPAQNPAGQWLGVQDQWLTFATQAREVHVEVAVR